MRLQLMFNTSIMPTRKQAMFPQEFPWDGVLGTGKVI